MKRLLILIITFFPILKIQSQIESKELSFHDHDCLAYYKDIPYTGSIENHFRNKAKKSTINFKNGKFDGVATYWYKNGQKKQRYFIRTTSLIALRPIVIKMVP